MTSKYIYLPATGKQIGLSDYVKAWKIVKENPNAEFKHGLTTWWSQKGSEIYKDFIFGLHDRINQRGKNNF